MSAFCVVPASFNLERIPKSSCPGPAGFRKPLYLNDGRTIATLAEARDVMVALSRLDQTNPHWARAAELLMEAAYRGRKDPIIDVGARNCRWR